MTELFLLCHPIDIHLPIRSVLITRTISVGMNTELAKRPAELNIQAQIQQS
jgi:hypothetical protein